MSLQQLAKEPSGRLRISPRLHQNIQHIPFLIYRPPQVVLIPADSDEHLVKMPGIPATPYPDADPLGIFRPESKTPLPNRFVGDLDAPAPQDLFDVSEAQRKPVVNPNHMADNFSWMPEATIQICVVAHGITLPRGRQLDSPLVNPNPPFLVRFLLRIHLRFTIPLQA